MNALIDPVRGKPRPSGLRRNPLPSGRGGCQLLKSASPGELLTDWHASGKLTLLLPGVERLFGVPQRPEHHPEVDTGVHVAMCLDMAQRLNASPAARFAVLLHDLGKADAGR